MTAERFHLKGLNGLRALAALAVVFSHVLKEASRLGMSATDSLAVASHGVTLFFVISGFLITYLLLLEKKKTGTVNVKAFYIRRILRIWPLYYLYFLVVVLVILIWFPSELDATAWFYIFFSGNFPFVFQISLPLLDHYWSLGVEEQFYIFWPWIVRRTERIVTVLWAIVIGMFLLKLACRIYVAKTGIGWPYVFMEVNRFDCMALGGLAAVFSYRKNQLFLRIVCHPAMELAAWVAVLLLSIGRMPMFQIFSNEFISVVSVILIMNVSQNPRRIINLDYPIFDFLGKISYGIYVIHRIVLFFVAKNIPDFVRGQRPILQCAFLLLLVTGLTIPIAWLSYHFYEKRFLRVKERYAVVPSSATQK